MGTSNLLVVRSWIKGVEGRTRCTAGHEPPGDYPGLALELLVQGHGKNRATLSLPLPLLAVLWFHQGQWSTHTPSLFSVVRTPKAAEYVERVMYLLV